MNMYFLIDFYDYPTYKTNSMIYEDCPTLTDLRVYIIIYLRTSFHMIKI